LAATVEELRVSNDRVRAMHAAAEQVAMLTKGLKCLDFGDVVELVTREVPRIFQADRGVLCFQDGLPGQCGFLTATFKRNCPASEQFLMDRADAKEAGRGSRIITCDVPCPCENLGGLSPSVIIPLRISRVDSGGEDANAERQAYICLCCLDKDPAMSRDLLLYMGGLVRDVLGTNLANAVLYSIARAQSETDSLTGACTRRILEARLDAEYQRAHRYGHPFCAVVIDVDNFKQINDMHGHAVGDRVLRELADVMRSEMRSSDTLARYGGDEFVWLMPETTSDAAAVAVERLRKSLECGSAADRQPVTISCGVSEWLGVPEDTAANVLRRADTAMYKAKGAGRNRIEVLGKSSATAVP
jgi:diguanylate cyclase (GGDEF)-like protein